jgi:hypothetical protein
MLVYTTVEAELSSVRDHVPAAVPLFGATSYHGVLVPQGFKRGAWGLGFEPHDELAVDHALIETNAHAARRDTAHAAAKMEERLGRPDAVLVHATPGFEERVVEGLAQAGWASSMLVFGGTAADDDLDGRWCVFDRDRSHGFGTDHSDEGVLLIAMRTKRPMHGGFVSGYMGTKKTGTVTRCTGRTIHAIDDRPAGEVLDEWMSGALTSARVNGGVVLSETSLSPIGRLIEDNAWGKRYLLSHPHQVHTDDSVSFFTEFSVGEEIEQMMGTRSSLVSHAREVVERALRGVEAPKVRGGVVVYCGGCVGAVEDRMDEVAHMFGDAVGGAPFIGAATYGEVGTFSIAGDRVTRHGNLMCDALLFG